MKSSKFLALGRPSRFARRTFGWRIGFSLKLVIDYRS